MVTRRRRDLPPAALMAAAAVLLLTVHATVQAFLLPSHIPAQPNAAAVDSSRRWAQQALAAAGQSTSAAIDDAAAKAPVREFRTRFDPEKGAQLASFSFAVYGNPSGSRTFRSKDGSDIGFHDDEVRFMLT